MFSFVSMYFLLFCLGFRLHLDLGISFVTKTSAYGDGTPFLMVPNSDLTSVFSLLTSFG
jgi:hypothetical protein